MTLFRSLVVPIDPDHAVDGARALPTAVALARRAGLSVDIITVAPLDADLPEVERSLGERLGEPPGAPLRIHGLLDAEPARAIAGFLADRPDALLVMSTHARGLVAERLLGSVSEAVLTRVQRPVLVVGPHVDRQEAGRLDTLVVGVGSAPAETIAAGVKAWQQSFHGRTPWLVDVVDPDAAAAVERAADVYETAHVHALARRVEACGTTCEWAAVRDDHPADGLLHFIADKEGPVLAVASRRWTDPRRTHLGSTARALSHRAPCPVLVLPA